MPIIISPIFFITRLQWFLNIRAQPMGWPKARGPSRPPMWGLGGQPEDVFEDVLEDVLERLLTMSIFLDIHGDHWISMLSRNICGYPWVSQLGNLLISTRLNKLDE